MIFINVSPNDDIYRVELHRTAVYWVQSNECSLNSTTQHTGRHKFMFHTKYIYNDLFRRCFLCNPVQSINYSVICVILLCLFCSSAVEFFFCIWSAVRVRDCCNFFYVFTCKWHTIIFHWRRIHYVMVQFLFFSLFFPRFFMCINYSRFICLSLEILFNDVCNWNDHKKWNTIRCCCAFFALFFSL